MRQLLAYSSPFSAMYSARSQYSCMSANGGYVGAVSTMTSRAASDAAVTIRIGIKSARRETSADCARTRRSVAITILARTYGAFSRTRERRREARRVRPTASLARAAIVVVLRALRFEQCNGLGERL